MLQIVGLALVGALIAVMVKSGSPEQGYLLSVTVVVAILLITLTALKPVIDYADQLVSAAKLDSELFAPLLKALGIAIIARVTAELCRDAKESAIAAVVEIGGAVLILFVSMPLLSSVLKLLESLL